MSRRKWTDEDKRFLFENFNKLSRKEIAQHVKRTVWAVQEKINYLGLSDAKFWTPEEDKFLKDNFFAMSKEHLLCGLPNRTWVSLYRRASILKVRRTKSKANIYFFDNWSQEMAYALGFIAADGCITENPMQLAVELSIKDIDHVSLLKNLIAPKNKVCVKDKKCIDKIFKSASFTTASDYMCKRLIGLGVVPRKSLKLQFPKDVPDDYLNHFVRGYFDGDGCISCGAVTFLGTKEFLSVLNNHINNNIGVGVKNIGKTQSKAFQLSYHSRQAIKLGEWMYKDSIIHLNRKKVKFGI